MGAEARPRGPGGEVRAGVDALAAAFREPGRPAGEPGRGQSHRPPDRPRDRRTGVGGEQHDPGRVPLQRLGAAQRRDLQDHPAHRVPHHHRAGDPAFAEHLEQVVGHALERVAAVPGHGLAVAPQVEREHPVAGGERAELAGPDPDPERDPVQEHDGWPVARLDHMDPAAVVGRDEVVVDVRASRARPPPAPPRRPASAEPSPARGRRRCRPRPPPRRGGGSVFIAPPTARWRRAATGATPSEPPARPRRAGRGPPGGPGGRCRSAPRRRWSRAAAPTRRRRSASVALAADQHDLVARPRRRRRARSRPRAGPWSPPRRSAGAGRRSAPRRRASKSRRGTPSA